jgi:phage tail sheath gpL-like
MVSFNNIPDSRLPFMWVEFDNSAASSSKPIWKTLIIGYKSSTGTAKENDLMLVSSEKQAIDYFGEGSNLHHQIATYKQNDTSVETWAVGITEGSKEATAYICFDLVNAANAIGAGIVSLFTFGEIIDIPVKGSKDIKDVTTEIALGITNNKKVPILAKVDATDPKLIILSTIHKTNIYNYGYSIVKNDFESKPLPNNLKFGVLPEGKKSDFSGGIGEPDIDGLFKSVIKDQRFQSFVSPFYSKVSNKKFSDNLDKRTSPSSQNDGVLFITTTINDLNDPNLKDCFGSLNSEYILTFSYASSLSPAYLINAAIAAQVSLSASIDPGMPLQTLALKGIQAPLIKDRATAEERTSFLNNGFGTITTVGDIPRIERALTSYKINDSGISDESYLPAENIFILSYLRYDIKSYFWSKYSRFKLGNDGGNYSNSQKIMTPNLAKTEIISRFLKWEELGLVQDSKVFIDNLVVERNAKNRGRLDFLLPPKLIDQLVQVSMQIQFR